MNSLILKLFVTRGFTRVTILAALFVLASCASGNAPNIRPMPLGNGNQNSAWIVTIHFENANSCKITHVTEDPATCPNAPSPGFCVLRNKFVQWESDPVNIRYNIYFDPIQGQQFHSTPMGILKRKIDATAPFSKYKYSILRDNCNADTDTFDPFIRVDN